jgi:hypothetical protein
MTKLTIIKNFISNEECDNYTSYLKNNEHLWEGNPEDANLASLGFSWNYRIINFKHNTEEMKQNLLELRKKMIDSIKESYNETEKLYTCFSQFVRLGIGQSLSAHADSITSEGKPSPGWWFADYSLVIYLNDDFVGGEICFPEYEKECRIERGMIIHYPSTVVHQVKEIKSESWRYTITAFFTKTKEHSDGY